MKVSYAITLNAAELKAAERILKEINPAQGIKQGEIKISQKSMLTSTLVKMKLKRTCKITMEMEISEKYMEWYADSVERLAPLVRGLVPQLVNLGEEAAKCASRIPEDTPMVTETQGV